MGDITRTKADVRALDAPWGVITGEAGGTIEAGETVYLDGANGWKRADASAASSISGLVGVLASPEDVVDGDTGLSIVIVGRVTGYSGMTPGAVHYVSNNDGEVATAAGTKTKRIGYASQATVLFVNANAPADPS